MSTRKPIEKKQSAADGPEWPAFFVPPVGFIQYVNPYAVLGIPEDTPQAEIASAVEKIDGVNDANRIEHAAAAIVSDPLRRLVWHCLRWPDKPPSAWTFLRRYRWTKLEGNIAAYLLHEAVARELQGLHGEALVELWEHVQREFSAFLANPRLEDELAKMAARWHIDSPTLPRKAKGALHDVVPAMHGVLMISSKKDDLPTFHGSKLSRPQGTTRLIGACLLRMRTRELDKARRALERGNIIAGLELYATFAQSIPQTDPREKRRLLFEIGETLTSQLAARSISATRDHIERIIDLLESIGSLTAFDSRLLSSIALFHVRAASCAAKAGDIHGAVFHLLQVGLCDPDRPFEMEMLKGDVLHVTTTGSTWSVGPPVSTQLLTTLNQWISALEAGNATLPNAFLRELRQLAPWIDLVTRLDLSLPHDKAIAVASTLLVELSAREPNEPFSVTKARMLIAEPEFADIPWKPIESLDTQGNVLFPELVVHSLPNPPAALDWPKSIRNDIKQLRNSHNTLEEHALMQRGRARASRAAFMYPWVFSDLSTSVKDVGTGLRHALIAPFALLGIAITLALAALSVLTLKFREGVESAEDSFKCANVVGDAVRAWFAFEYNNEGQPRTLYGLAKFQALAAMVLMAAGLFYFADKFGREYLVLHQRDKAYTELCNAASTKDMTAVARAARGFLNATPPEKFDYRTLDVLEKHSEALVREMARAARDKRQADLDQLVAEATTVQKRTQTEKQAWKEIEEAR